MTELDRIKSRAEVYQSMGIPKQAAIAAAAEEFYRHQKDTAIRDGDGEAAHTADEELTRVRNSPEFASAMEMFYGKLSQTE
jgi:hypothetical protein